MPSLENKIHRDIVHARRAAANYERTLWNDNDPVYLAIVGARAQMSPETVRAHSSRFLAAQLTEVRNKWMPELSKFNTRDRDIVWTKAFKPKPLLDWLL